MHSLQQGKAAVLSNAAALPFFTAIGKVKYPKEKVAMHMPLTYNMA